MQGTTHAAPQTAGPKAKLMLILLVVPLALLNTFGGLVGAVWLGFAGEWGVLGAGLLGLMIGGVAISLAMMPAALLIIPTAAAFEKGHNTVAYTMVLLFLAWTFTVLGFWGYLTFAYFVSEFPMAPRLPLMLWTYAVAVGPACWRASKDMGNPPSQLSTSLFSCICAISMFVAWDLRWDFEPLRASFMVGCTAIFIASSCIAGEMLRNHTNKL